MTKRVAARARLAITLALILAYLSGGALFFRLSEEVAAGRRSVDHTGRVIRTIDDFSGALLDAESNERAYIITQSPAYLAIFEQARDRIPIVQATLRTLTVDNPDQQQRLDRLARLVQQKMAQLAQTITLRDNLGFDAARREVESHLTMNLVTAVRDVIEEIRTEEVRLLGARQRAVEVLRTRALWIVLGGGVLTLAVVVGSSMVLRREEQRRRTAEQEAVASAARLRTSFDGLSQGIAVFSSELTLVEWNLCLIELLDVPSGVARRDVSYEDFTAAVGAELFESGPQIAEDLRAPGERDPVVYDATTEGGRTLEVRRTPMPGGAGFILTVTDVTAQRRAELAQRDTQKMQALGHLTGGVAHDFNNLLTVVMGNLDLLKRRLPDDPDVTRRLDDAIASAIRGANLTRHLLAFARRQPLEPKPVDLNRLVAELVNSVLRRTLGEEIDVQLVETGGLWPAFADAAQVENAVLNLALNARDAMAVGGRLTIEISNQMLDHHYCRLNPDVEPGAYVMVAVTDTGCGMSPETIARAFEPFYSTKSEGKGTGLGLSQVYGFAKQSKGHVKIYSEVGQGTTVKLYLPRSQRAPKDEIVTGLREVPRGSARILVVEDDADVRRVVVAQLQELGYQVQAAQDAESGLDAFTKAERIDLLLTDVILPGRLRGKELAALITRASPETRVLFMSGYTENAIVHDGKLDEGVNLIGKPFRREEIGRKVAQVLQAGGPPADEAGNIVRFPDGRGD